ncbi:MAG: enolase C-terminal domain-like protein, partial [Planctomycetota bacterium]
MKIAEIRLQRYDLELVKPITVKGHALEKRSGLILSVIDSAGRVGYGEVSPLPFLHAETIDEAVLCISQIRQTVVGMDVQDETIPFSDPIEKNIGIDLFPSVSFGIETALFDLYFQRADCQSLSGLNVPVCGLTGTASESFCADLQQMHEQGYSAVKIKVGAHSIAEDADKIKAAKEIIQDKMVLRLDANRAW